MSYQLYLRYVKEKNKKDKGLQFYSHLPLSY